MKTRHATVRRALLCCAIILGLAMPGLLAAQTNDNASNDNSSEVTEAPQPSLDDSIDLEGFVDGLMAAHLEEHRIPGAAIALVHEGEIIFAKGYGYADLETLTPVDAETTLFRIGSVTKLFIWTAAMQLVEEGLLDLDADVNIYLADSPVHVPATFPASPVTMRHLMAHTAGFEDRVIGLFARDETALAPLESLLLDMPARVRPPGVYSAYSNHGNALAAHIVAEIAGMNWEEYVESRILTPLGMERTTVRQPVPAELETYLAQGYSYRGARQHAEGFEYVPLAPAGSASTTAVDMARFMLAHLQLGSLDGARILDEATARQMQTQHFSHAPLLPGMAHGFIENSLQDLHWLGHAGDTFWFHAGLYLAPEAGAGIFVVYNGAEGGAARAGLFQAIRTRYFDAPDEIVPTAPTTTREQLARFTGAYQATRVAQTTADKISALMMNFTVGAEADGHLTVSGPGIEPIRFTEIGPGRFRQIESTGLLGREEIVFEFDPDTERPVAVYYSEAPFMAFERAEWFQTLPLHASLFLGALLLSLIAVVAWPIQFWRNRSRPGRKARVGQWAHGVGTAAALLLLVYVGLFVALFSDPLEVAYGMPPGTEVLGALSLLLPVLAAAMVGLTAFLWVNGSWRFGGRIFYTLVTLFLAALVWQLWFWNFLGLSLIG